MARRQIALLPSPIFVLPLALEAPDHRRAEVGRVLAEQGGEGLLEIAGGNPAQIENRQQRVQALGAPRPFGQDVRREAKALPRSGGAIAGLRLLHFDRADSGLDRANRIMPVANHPLAAIRKHELRGRGQKCLELRLHRLGDQTTRAGSQYFSERIVDCPLSVEEQQLYSRSWRNAPAWRFGWLDHQPRYAAFLTPSPSFPHSSSPARRRQCSHLTFNQAHSGISPVREPRNKPLFDRTSFTPPLKAKLNLGRFRRRR